MKQHRLAQCMPLRAGSESRLVGMALLCLALVGCASPRSTGEFTGSQAPLNAVISGEPDFRREARLLRMADQRQPDTLLIDQLLRDVDPGRRARTALAIGQLKVRSRYPELRALLLDGDTAVAANAAYALGIGRDSAAVTQLAAAVAGAPDPVAREAAWALGELGEPAREAIVGLLSPIGSTPGSFTALSPAGAVAASRRTGAVRAAIVLSTVKLKPAPISVVRPWLQDPDAAVVRAAAYVIGRLRSPDGARDVMSVSHHSDDEVRQHVARTLTPATVGDSLAHEALQVLRELLKDPNEGVRINAVRSISGFGAQVADQVLPLFSDPAPNVRVAAAEGAASVFLTNLEFWQKAWDADTALAARKLLFAQARRAGVALAPETETLWARHPDWQYRRALARDGERLSGAALGDSSVLEALLSDPDSRVQRAARAALGRRIRDSSGAQQAPRPPGPPSIPVRSLAEYERVAKDYSLRRTPLMAYIDTDHGTVTLELATGDAPLVVEAFVRLARDGSYANTNFHRVVPNFVAQDGDKAGDGSGQVDFRLRESWTRRRHERGCLGLATAGPDTGGSQYYLCHASQPHLDGAYTVFGQVVSGFDVMDRIVQGDRMLRVRVPRQ